MRPVARQHGLVPEHVKRLRRLVLVPEESTTKISITKHWRRRSIGSASMTWRQLVRTVACVDAGEVFRGVPAGPVRRPSCAGRADDSSSEARGGGDASSAKNPTPEEDCRIHGAFWSPDGRATTRDYTDLASGR